MKSKIPVSEITKRHPDMLYCPTDREYANLANEIYDMICKEFTFMDDKEIRKWNCFQSSRCRGSSQ